MVAATVQTATGNLRSPSLIVGTPGSKYPRRLVDVWLALPGRRVLLPDAEAPYGELDVVVRRRPVAPEQALNHVQARAQRIEVLGVHSDCFPCKHVA